MVVLYLWIMSLHMVDKLVMWIIPLTLGLWHIYGGLTTIHCIIYWVVPLFQGFRVYFNDLEHGSMIAHGTMPPLFMDLGF